MCVLMFIDWRSGGGGGGEVRGANLLFQLQVFGLEGRRSHWGNECINVGSWLWYDGQHLPECRGVTEWRKLKIRQLLKIAELSTCCVIHY